MMRALFISLPFPFLLIRYIHHDVLCHGLALRNQSLLGNIALISLHLISNIVSSVNPRKKKGHKIKVEQKNMISTKKRHALAGLFIGRGKTKQNKQGKIIQGRDGVI
ncbi:hypothetical protein BDW59DRAFT_30598 [Aspergillus cavernicola]|uniref:Secreted protein n=1 Tax=Aspergillus cavernicola TaxID=176166 RepID=A0ABR4HDR2_9EURO